MITHAVGGNIVFCGVKIVIIIFDACFIAFWAWFSWIVVRELRKKHHGKC